MKTTKQPLNQVTFAIEDVRADFAGGICMACHYADGSYIAIRLPVRRAILLLKQLPEAIATAKVFARRRQKDFRALPVRMKKSGPQVNRTRLKRPPTKNKGRR